jgi:histidine triad (HIT) family protein
MTGPCPFCARIDIGQYEHSDVACVAFTPLNPVTPGHVLVVPRIHVPDAIAFPALAGQALRFAGFLASRLGLQSANFITSAGAAATQTVFHLHVHIVPRSEGDGLHLPWTSTGREGPR